jgi:hypothetical protein
MKFFRLSYLLCLFSAILLLGSCSKDDNSSNPSPTNSNKMTANISGAVVKSFNAVQTIFMLQSVGSMSQSIVTGYSGNQISQSDNITLQLINLADGPQTIDLSSGLGTVMFVSYNNGSVQQYIASEGTINITQNNSTAIKGTFSFNCGNPGTSTYVHVTDGSFSCNK